METRKKMKIRMLCGSYGYRNEQGGVEVKDVRSGPFAVDSKEGEKLIRMGYATDASMPSGWGRRDGEGGIGDFMELESLVSMNKRQLEQIAKDMGVSASGGKEEIAARIYNMMEEKAKKMTGIEEEDPVD